MTRRFFSTPFCHWLASFFCFRFVPETKGVPLEIIERNLRAGNNGVWSTTLQGKDFGPIQIKGYWVSINVLEDGVWKDRMVISNITPAPAATPSPTASPSNQ